MVNPYETCPAFENENYLLRLVDFSDAPDLLAVYSDRYAVPFADEEQDDTNITLGQVQELIQFWEWNYRTGRAVCWTVFDKNSRLAIGTMEISLPKSDGYTEDCALLRLNLRDSYERADRIGEILSLILDDVFDLFDCRKIAMRVPSASSKRNKFDQNSTKKIKKAEYFITLMYWQGKNSVL